MVAKDYSEIGGVAWGDHFDLTNGALIGDGLENTQQIVEGNLNDNSSVPNGLEFGSDDYAFKIVADLEYQTYNDWFIPSSGSMRAIFENLHSQGLGDFDETKVERTYSSVSFTYSFMLKEVKPNSSSDNRNASKSITSADLTVL